MTARARAALFDMDGTLVDSTAVVETVWTEVARRHGLDPAEILAAAHGVRAADTMRLYLEESAVAEAVAALEAREIELVEGIVEIPGAGAYLASLHERGIPFAVVTSAVEPLARVRLAAAGLDVPEVLVTAHDIRHGKPAPDGYLLAAERLGVDPADCVVFEDAEAGLRAGLAAGCETVVVGDGRSPATAGLQRVVDYRTLLADPGLDPLA